MNDLTRNETFTRFGKNFQEKLCQLMLEDRPFFDQIMEVLDISFFEKKYIQIFAQTLINYRNKICKVIIKNAHHLFRIQEKVEISGLFEILPKFTF